MKNQIKPWRVLTAAALALTLGLGALTAPAAPVHAAASDLDLAYRWAPVHYQDTDSTDYDADYITAVNYDGDWNTLNNWDNQDDSLSRLQAKAYFSVTETSSHWYIVYSFYHPRDWVDYPDFGLDTHENDMEGAMMIVRKDGSAYGKFEGMVTVFHNDFYSYTPSGSPLTGAQETIDGTARLASYGGYSRPTTFQEAKGHGIKAWDGSDYAGTDVVVYYPSKDTAEVPSGGNDREVKYQLVDTFAANGLWAHRSDTQTFASWGTFRGDDGRDNAANAAWGWDDSNDGDALQRGLLATDPAKLVSVYFGNLGTFSRTYTRNGYTQ
ncbi:hypothetical protein ACVNS2_36235 [Paenibacillus caseinilyticus]|uniref:Uncharacterized protein n=1 Tax=Paenibacillus mucilaginosus K02 TaxID=997761 RepID=I0BUT8_9BACL|nr:hypothetical protein [Paenibacillus mucilaginosus]AFH66135.1 hypothetical protein B2K_36480 [Paenibacillus mucilaginosus K02]AFK65279.1 hypothetical protein [Paenibacillus mucilaginosus K02]